MARLWAIKVTQGNDDRGWLIDHGRVIAVYDDKDYAEKEAKWLSDFQKRCGSKTVYEVKKWVPEDGVETALQTGTVKASRMPKMSEKKQEPPTEAAPSPTIPTNLSDLLVNK